MSTFDFLVASSNFFPVFFFSFSHFYFLFSNHSIIEFTAHTPPDANSPSKNHEIHVGVSYKKLVGENKVRLKKNPTHVDVHIIQEIKPEMNFKIGESSAQACTHCLCVSKIEP